MEKTIEQVRKMVEELGQEPNPTPSLYVAIGALRTAIEHLKWHDVAQSAQKAESLVASDK